MKKRPILLVALASILVFATLSTGTAVAASKKPPPASTSSWSSALAISGVNQPDPTRGSQLNDVAVNASGLTIAAWDQYTYTNGGPATIGAAVQSGGSWSAPFTISGATGFSMDPRVAVGTDGTMAVTWIYQDPATNTNPRQAVQVAVRSANSTTWTTATLQTGPMGGVAITGFAPVGIDANGNITVAWNLWDGARHVVQSATLLKGGTWSAPVTLSAPSADGLYLDLSVNARGDAAVAYTLSAYTSYATGTYAQVVSRTGPTGTWSTPMTVSETMPSSVSYITSPEIGLDGNGLATVVYLGYGVEGVRQLADGTWTKPQTVIAAPNPVLSSVGGIDLGVDQNGNSVVATSIFDATIGVDRSSVWVARGTAAGTWTPSQRITDPTVPVDAYASRVAVSPDGTLALVGWIDHYHGTVQVSQLAGGVWGPAATVGRGTAWSSFQEVLGLDAASGTVARAIWKNAKAGTQTMAANYRG